MLERLGNVLYWACLGAGTLVFLCFVIVALIPGTIDGGIGQAAAAAIGLVLGVVVWGVGYACRYVLTGKRAIL